MELKTGLSEKDWNLLLSQWLLRMNIGRELRRFLSSIVRPDAYGTDFGLLLENNEVLHVELSTLLKKQMSGSSFSDSASSEDESEDILASDKILHLLGLTGTRNALFALWIQKQSESEYSLNLRPSIQTVLDVIEHFESNRMGYVKEASCCGFFWDLFKSTFESNELPQTPPIKNYLQQEYLTAWSAARAAYWLGAPLENFDFQKDVFFVSFGIAAGKVAMATLFDDWLDYSSSLKDFADPGSEIRVPRERKEFHLTHGECGALFLDFFGLASKEAGFAVRHYLEPSRLIHRGDQLARLGVITRVGQKIAHGVDSMDKLSFFEKTWLDEAGVNPTDFGMALAKSRARI